MRLIILLLTYSTLVFGSDAFFKPSFKCENVKKSSIEYLICKNKEVAELDKSLSDLYTQALKIDQKTLKVNQKAWLKNVRNSCKTTSCLKSVYFKREFYLGSLLTKTNSFHYDSKFFWKEKDPLKYVEKFNKDKNIKIIHCNTTWATIAGRVNSAYGGICSAKVDENIIKVHVCYNMAFSFKIEPIKQENEFSLIKFLEYNCWGG